MKLGRKRDDEPGSIKNFYGNRGTDAVEEANKRYFGDSGDSIHHSRYYHRYYEGYTEVRTPNPASKYKPYKIQRIYTAPYTVADMDPGMYLVHMIFYGMLAAAADALFIWAFADRNVSVNMSKLSALTTIVTAVPLFLLTVCLVSYYLRPRKMKCYDYRSSTGRLKTWSLVASASCLLALIVFCVFIFVTGSVNPKSEILYGIRLLLASGFCLALFFLERGMRYKEEPNPVELPEGEYHRIH